jgi:outer membrane receptor protein involved in Fe transport
MLLSHGVVMAQTLNTSSMRGQVLDQNGAAIVGAEVTVTNLSTGLRREVRTDESGYYTVSNLPLTGKYKLSVSSSGFALKEVDDIELRAEEAASLNVTLLPEGSQSEVTILGTTEGIQADSPRLETRLDLQKIDNTPVLGRKPTNLPLLNSAVRSARGTGDLFLNNTLFVINGGGRRQTTFTVDGNTGDDAWGRQTIFTNIPFSAIQEFTVLTNSFSAEYGRTTGSAINIVTKSGTNNLHGDVLFMFRPSGLEANAPFTRQHTADILYQLSGVVSGPIVKDRTHFLFAAEYNNQKRDAVITSPLAPGTLFRGLFHQGLLLGRIDHQLNARNTLTGKFNFEIYKDTNPADAVSNLNLASADRIFKRRTYTAQISETAVLSSHMVNEVRAQFQSGSPITQFDPTVPSPQFVIPGIATVGESRSALLTNHQFEVADTLALIRGKHNLKIGGDLIHSSSGGNGQEFGSGFVLGQFTFNPARFRALDQLAINDVTSFLQSFGNASYNVGETYTALFVQDNWNVHPNLTLNLGLRYENQSFTDDRNNFSPRFGFAWNVRGDGRTVIRGSYGIFYSEIRANLAASYEINGPTGIFTFTAQPGQFGFPTSLAPLPAFPPGVVLPPRNINIRVGRRDFYSQFFDVSRLREYPDKLLNPYTQQWTVGVERELAPGWILDVDFVRQHTIGIDRTVDLNAPDPFIRTAPGQVRSAAAADATRPIRPVANGFRLIQATINDGDSYYTGLQTNLKKRFGQRFSLLLSYTLSKTENTVEPDAPGGQDPNEQTLRSRVELGRSLLDQRHRAALSGWYVFPHNFVFAANAQIASGRPYNIITGADNNGDFIRTDRPVINGQVVGRNTGRGSALYDVSAFLEKRFLFGEQRELDVRVEGFNLFNHNNVVGRNNTFGNAASGIPVSTFGQPLGGISNVDPSREFQFQVRLRY